jgi:hypothetical protein
LKLKSIAGVMKRQYYDLPNWKGILKIRNPEGMCSYIPLKATLKISFSKLSAFGNGPVSSIQKQTLSKGPCTENSS